jgi:hypothetical protein
MLQILVLGGGWQTVATLLLAASFNLPRLPRHRLWPWRAHWMAALLLAASVLAPTWPHRWQRWLAGIELVHASLKWCVAYRSTAHGTGRFG